MYKTWSFIFTILLLKSVPNQPKINLSICDQKLLTVISTNDEIHQHKLQWEQSLGVKPEFFLHNK